MIKSVHVTNTGSGDLSDYSPSGGGGGGGGVIPLPGGGIGLDGCQTPDVPLWVGGGAPPQCNGTDENGSDPELCITTIKLYTGYQDEELECKEVWLSACANAGGKEEKPIPLANLELTVPAGIQSCDKGIALMLTKTLHNAFGLLTRSEEIGEGVIVAPPPEMDAAGNPTGGLGVIRVEGDSKTCGLHVLAGEGLWVNGMPEAEPGEKRAGRIEVKFGPGFKVRTGAGDKDFDTEASTKINALYLNYKWGLKIPALDDMGGTENEIQVNYGRGLTIPEKDSSDSGEDAKKLQVRCGLGLGFHGEGTSITPGKCKEDAITVHHGHGLCLYKFDTPESYTSGGVQHALEVYADPDDFQFGTGDKAGMLQLKDSDTKPTVCGGCASIETGEQGIMLPVILPNLGVLTARYNNACTIESITTNDVGALYDGLRIAFMHITSRGYIKGIYDFWSDQGAVCDG